MSAERKRPPRVPPRWFVRIAWSVHRGMYRATAGRLGLWRARPDRWGTLRLTCTGRRSGRERTVIIAYLEDGQNLISLAMNGWGEGAPAWWLNLQANPDATVEVPATGVLPVRARAARGEERSRLWLRWQAVNADMDAYAALRSAETAVVVFEPRAPA